MNQDIFEGSETVGQSRNITRSQTDALAATIAEDSETVDDMAIAHDDLLSVFGDGNGTLGYDNAAEMQDMRLKRCGLVWKEDQLNGRRWVAPPAQRTALDHDVHVDPHRFKVLPLYLVKPMPGLEIEATDGEKYLLPLDFKGDWFAVKSPTGKELIPQ